MKSSSMLTDNTLKMHSFADSDQSAIIVKPFLSLVESLIVFVCQSARLIASKNWGPACFATSAACSIASSTVFGSTLDECHLHFENTASAVVLIPYWFRHLHGLFILASDIRLNTIVCITIQQCSDDDVHRKIMPISNLTCMRFVCGSLEL